MTARRPTFDAAAATESGSTTTFPGFLYVHLDALHCIALGSGEIATVYGSLHSVALVLGDHDTGPAGRNHEPASSRDSRIRSHLEPARDGEIQEQVARIQGESAQTS